jgi:RNA polymerase sigma-70 factor (ECF subfamily)
MPTSPLHSPVATDEITLVARAKHDRHAFALLYQRYVTAVYRYCYRRLGSKEDAEDATSQIFAQVLAALPRLGEQPFRAWLFTIAHHVVADVHRARIRLIALPQTEEQIDPALTPEQHLVAAEDGRFIRMLLAHLPAESRQLLELRLAGLTDVEIADVLGKSHGAVRVAQHRTVVRLRALRATVDERERGNA